MRNLLTTSLCSAALAFLGIGCASERTISGTFTLVDSGVERDALGCHGTGGYSDIKSGVKVVVKNERSEIIGISNLDSDIYDGTSPSVVCKYPFEVKGLPAAAFYSIEVGRRGSLTYSPKRLDEQDWKVSLSLGS